jgi:tRNA-dihydrouridine synthase B
VIGHYQDMLSHHGVEIGLRQARKHLGWYLDRAGEAVPLVLRQRILRSFDPQEVEVLLREAFALPATTPLASAA